MKIYGVEVISARLEGLSHLFWPVRKEPEATIAEGPIVDIGACIRELCSQSEKHGITLKKVEFDQ